MNQNNKPAELSYYGLYLLSYLKENHPDKAHDAVFVESRADRAGIEAGDTRLTLNSQSPADLTALDAFFSAQQQPCVITIQRKGKTLDIHLPAP